MHALCRRIGVTQLIAAGTTLEDLWNRGDNIDTARVEPPPAVRRYLEVQFVIFSGRFAPFQWVEPFSADP